MSIPSLMKRSAGSIIRGQQGVAMIEFAISVTLLLIMFFGAIEVSRYILIVQKVEKTIDTLTDVFTQSTKQNVCLTTVTEYLSAASLLMTPYPMGSNGVVYFTDVNISSTGVATVNWQVNSTTSGGTLSAASQVGPSPSQGSTANLTPTGLTPLAGQQEEILVGEMYYNVQPVLAQDLISPIQVYRVAVFKPRFESGLNLSSTNCQ